MGESAKGLGTRVSVTDFSITHSFGLFPNASSSASHLPNSVPPAPPEVQRASGGPHLDLRGLSPVRSPGPLHQLFRPWGGGTQGDSALISSSEAPQPSTHRSLRSWAKVKDAGALPGAASTRLELSKCAGCCWTVGAAAANCHLLLQCLRGDVLLGRFSFLSVLKADVSVGKMLGKMKT